MYPPIAVMFDWRNTLVKELVPDHAVIRKVLDLIGREDIDLRAAPDGKITEYLAYSLGNQWGIALRLYESILKQSKKTQKWLTNDNVHELLELLHAKNVSMGIVSNNLGKHLRMEVKEAGLSKYFSAIIGSGDTPEDKPSPKPIIAALEILDITPSNRVFFVGDSITDIESARRAKCYPIAYNNSSKGVLSFTNFRDFGSFIQSLLG